MSENTERLAAIQKRLGDATPGPWVTGGSGYVETVPEVDLHRFDIMPETIARAELREEDAEFIAAAPADVAFLLDLARKQQAQINAVERLAIGWTLRGEYDMRFSKTLPDPDIADAILTNGAQMVENGRHIRNALEAKP